MSHRETPSSAGQPAQRQLRILGAVALGLAAGAACLVSYAVHGSLPYNPLELPGEKKLLTRTWAPEGWKFFTRNAQEERPVLFTRRNGAWERAEQGPASRPRYLFGLNREGRAQGLEFGLLLEQLPASAWRVWRQAAALGVREASGSSASHSGAPGLAHGRCQPDPGARAFPGRVVLRLKPPQPREPSHCRALMGGLPQPGPEPGPEKESPLVAATVEEPQNCSTRLDIALPYSFR
ncbi:SdpA family antimicrobial peptide system protein [Archangium violaceum]|uniref:SdpA family antimicrobial peptide system protein n=1 Tax=Archangium violaceum TaxID=83451 RepID=UPI0036D7D609